MRHIFVATVLTSATLSAPAFGADIKSALKDFGLPGTWSADCSKPMSDPGGGKLSFAAPGEGGPTATVQDNKAEVSVTTVYEVGSAIIDSDKITMALHALTITRSDGKTAPQREYDNLRLVFQKVGERIEIIRVQFEGLPEIERASFFEKCRD